MKDKDRMQAGLEAAYYADLVNQSNVNSVEAAEERVSSKRGSYATNTFQSERLIK